MVDFIAIVFSNYTLSQQIHKNFIKYVLLFFIPIMEVSYTKKFAIEIIGWVASGVICISFFFNTLRWFDTKPYIFIAFVILFFIFLNNHIYSKKIKYLNLLFQLFFFNRIILILSKHNEVLWWIDQTICFAVFIVSIVYLIKYIKNNLIEKKER